MHQQLINNKFHWIVQGFLILLISLNTSSSAKTLNIITTTSTLEAIAKEVSGLKSVESLVKGSQDPHYIQAKPSYIAKVRKADVLISIGMGLEDAWLNKIIVSSRNTKVALGKKGHLSVGNMIQPIDVPQGQVTRAMGDVHAEGNPHFLLDPVRAIKVAKGISDRLSELDPQQSITYINNFQKFKKELEKNIVQWGLQLSNLKNKSVITHHTTLNYFIKRFGLEHAGSIEIKPGIPPSAKHIQNLIAQIKHKKVSCILLESFFDDGPAKAIAQKTGIKLEQIAPEVNALNQSKNYTAWLDEVVLASARCLN